MNDTFQIALIGNPNTGKTTLFNALTGSRQRVGNYPGVTIEKKVGEMRIGSRAVELLDLPGTYSLSASSPDECVVVDALIGNIKDVKRPDLILCVVDATNFMRNLFLASQVAELGIPMVIALNQWDMAKRWEMNINVERMSRNLGVPVIPTVALKKEGIDELLAALEKSIESPKKMVAIQWPEAFERAIRHVGSILEHKFGEKLTDVELRRILFDAESAVADRFKWSREERKSVLAHARKPIFESGLNAYSAEAVLHYRHLQELMCETICQGQDCMNARSESIDRLLTHRVWGLVIFVGMMWFVFQAVYTWAGPLMDAIEFLTVWTQTTVGAFLESTPMLQSLVVDGIIGGFGGVAVFLPQILILFFFIGILEDTGYMPRAAFLMDKLFSWCGLNGKSFVPLLSSYACAIPGVLATRTIGDPKARLATILIAPLMSCSARLPVYVLMIGAFVEPIYGSFVAGLALFAMHFIGLFIAIPIAWIITKFILRSRPQPFLMEMCTYRVPQFNALARRMFDQGKEFIIRAGTIIVAFSIIIWALLYFPKSTDTEQKVREHYTQELMSADSSGARVKALDDPNSGYANELQNRTNAAFIENSYMGRIGKWIQPVFELAGFDWKITVGVLASFPAREVIIATLGITYSLGSEHDESSTSLRERMIAETWPAGTQRAGTPVFNIPVVCAIMMFFALCMQCGATLSVITREANWKWASFCFIYMTALAWIGAVLTYQAGMLFY